MINKGKMKFWRWMSIKQFDGTTEILTGRELRDMLRSQEHCKVLSNIKQSSDKICKH